MHSSRLCALLIDCRVSDIDQAAKFWADALGREIDSEHPGTRGNYRMLATPPDEPIVQIQRVDHEYVFSALGFQRTPPAGIEEFLP